MDYRYIDRTLLAAGSDIVALLNYLHPFSLEQPAFTDGSLVKSGDQPAEYVVYGGAKFCIPSPKVFKDMGFHSDEVQTISDSAIAAIPNVPSDSTLLKEFSTPSVYVMQGGVRHHVLSSSSVVALGGGTRYILYRMVT